MWWDIHQGICCCSWCPGDVWVLSSKSSNKSRNIIVLTFTKPLTISSSTTIYLYIFLFDWVFKENALWNPPCQAQPWILQQVAAQSKHTYTAEWTVWCSCWNSGNRQSPSGPPYTLSTDVTQTKVIQVLGAQEQRCQGCGLTHPPQWVCNWRKCPQCWWPHRRRCPDPPGMDCWRWLWTWRWRHRQQCTRKAKERQLIMNMYLAVETNVAFPHKPRVNL